MTDEERRIISDYVARVSGAQQPAVAPSSSPWGGRIPQTGPQAAPLPPVDPEADRLISDLFTRYPEARYRITQTAFVQEHALVEAQNRIQQLEWELENATRQAQASQSRGLFGLGGSRPAPMPPRPEPQYPPNYNPQAFQGRQGPGFLGTALTTAAGVAGGMFLGNMLMNAFSGSHGAASAASATSGGFANEAVPTSSAWTDPGGAAAAQGWGGNDASGGGYDDPGAGYSNDASGGYDDGGGYDDEI
ncbi:DUF2076 domain-containing protein [Roseococcus sp. YIM B11640]|uniref:DUF2076 domain-containing protein n=1 Tax=Roseococcus sp. YIM B11640 TaxID=3133973 RepID=UPI003C7CADCD